MNKKKYQTFKTYISACIGIVLLVIMDQWTKFLAVEKLKNQTPFIIFNHVFELHYLENRGAAFGLFQNQRIFFLIIGVVMLSVIMFVYGRIPKEKRYLWLKICLLLICSGAIGNMIDRTLNGYVVDFLYFSLIDFPIFNVADIYVTVAAFLLVFLIVFYYKEDELEAIFHNRA